jgi:hypothetical protein
MPRKLRQYKPSNLILLSLLLLFIPLIYYFWSYVPNQEAELSQRYTRLLAITADQLEGRITNLLKVLTNFKISLLRLSTVKSFFDFLGKNPELGYQSSDFVPFYDPSYYIYNLEFLGVGSRKTQTRIILIYEVKYYKAVLLRGSPLLPQKNAKIKSFTLEVWIDVPKLAELLCIEEFDDYLLFNKEGEVYFQRERNLERGVLSGLRIMMLENEIVLFENEQDSGKLSSSKVSGKKSTASSYTSKYGEEKVSRNVFSEAVPYSHQFDLLVAQKKYKLFVQPFSFSIFKDLGKKGSFANNMKEEWFIGGLLSSEKIIQRSKKILSNWLLYLALFVTVLLIAFPVIKYFAISSLERYVTLDAFLLGLFIILIIPLTSNSLLNATHWFYFEEMNVREMKELSGRLHDDLQNELNQAYDQIRHYVVHFQGELLRVFLSFDHEPVIIRNMNFYRNFFGGEQIYYPFFDTVFLIDKIGSQNLKKTIENFAHANIFVRERDYYSDLKREEYCYLNGTNPIALEPGYSSHTGEYEIVLAIPFIGDQILATAIEIKPLSVIEPVMPHGYEFAIVNSAGKVLFHSDHNLNSYENLFSECENPGSLAAAIDSRSEHLFRGQYYHGRLSNIYIRPVKHLPWMLMIIQDRELHAGRNFIVNSIAMFSYLRYCLILVVLFLTFFLFLFVQNLIAGYYNKYWHCLHYKWRWLWPHREFSGLYLNICIINLGLFIVVMAFRFLSKVEIEGLLLVPFCSLLFTYVIVMFAIHRLENENNDNYNLSKTKAWLTLLPILPLFLFFVSGYMYQLFFKVPQQLQIPSKMIIPLALVYLILEFVRRFKNRAEQSEKKTTGYRKKYQFALFSVFLVLLVFPALHFWIDSYRTISNLQFNYQQCHLAQQYSQWKKEKEDKFSLQLNLMQRQDKREFDCFSWAKFPGVYPFPFSNTKFLATRESSLLGFIKSFINYTITKPIIPKAFTNSDRADFERFWQYLRFEILNLFGFLEAYTPQSIQSYFGLPDILVKYVLMPNRCFRQIYFLSQLQNRKDEVGLYQFGDLENKYSFLKYSESYKSKNRILIWWKQKKDMWGYPSRHSQIFASSRNINIFKFYIFLGTLILSLVILGGLFLIVQLVSRAVFLVNLQPLEDKERIVKEYEVTSEEFLGRRLVLGDVIDRVTIETKFMVSEYIFIDCTNREYCNKEWDGLIKSGKRIFIANFDYLMHDANLNVRKLELLEKFAAISNVNVVIFSQFHPISYFNLNNLDAPKKTDEERNVIPDRYEEPNHFVQRWERAMSRFEIRYFYSLPRGDEPDSEYAKIWRTCSSVEKIAMIHLAEDKLANVKNKKVLNSLLSRGLLRLAPIRFYRRRFKKFVLNADDRERLLEWNRSKVGEGIKRISHPFMLFVFGALLFLFMTQPKILHSGLIIIPALVSAIPALVKLFDIFPSASEGE